MNKTIILAVILSPVAGFIGWHTFNGTLPQLIETVTSTIQPLIAMVQPAITKAQEMWAIIPESIRGYILPGIIGSVMGAYGLFMTWTKLRVMEGAEQAKVEATVAFNQVSGEATDYKQQLQQVTTERDSFQQQIGQQSNLGFEELTKARDEAQSMVTVKAGELNDANAVIRSMQTRIEDLIKEVELLKPKVYP